MQRDFLDPGGYAAKAGLDISRLRNQSRRSDIVLRPPGGESMWCTREGHLPDLSDCPPQN
jgi:hypothetical protein